MRQLVRAKRLIVMGMTLTIFTFSCTSSKYAGGFAYNPGSKAPDIAAGSEKAAIKKGEPEVAVASSPAAKTLSEEKIISEVSEKVIGKLSGEQKEKFKKIDKAFHEAGQAHRESGEPVSNRELMQSVTKKLTEEGTIEALTTTEAKKLDKAAIKMDKKLLQQGNDIDVKHNTNLELFFLIMAVAGLVLGILGVWLGWVLLVVFGGLWLYYKLVKD